jgi:hypothetical protein
MLQNKSAALLLLNNVHTLFSFIQIQCAFSCIEWSLSSDAVSDHQEFKQLSDLVYRYIKLKFIPITGQT